MLNMASIKNSIESSGKRVLSAYHDRFTSEMMSIVADVVLNELRKKNRPRLFDDDVEIIKNKLIFNKRPNSRKTWRTYDCYNKLATDLNQTSDITCRFIYIPTQINRNLIITPSDELQDHVRLVHILDDDLLSLPHLEGGAIEQQELEYVCSFIAAAGIFGKMLFDQYHRRLLSIKFRDIHFAPVYINMPYLNSDAFYRYFLPYPASAYFMRLILFYQRNYKELKIKKPHQPEDNVIVPVHFNEKDLATKFRKWASKRLRNSFTAHGEADAPSITIDQFRSAVKSASAVDIAPKHLPANCYPPFIISVQSGEIQSYSYSNRFFDAFLGTDDIEPEYRYEIVRSDKQSEPDTINDLRKALTEIKKIRRALLRKPDSVPERRAASHAIKAVIESYKPPRLTDPDYLNLELFAKWVDSMLQYKTDDDKKKAASIDNYIPKVEKLLCELSEDGLIIYDMPVEKLKEAVIRIMRPLNSSAIKKVLKLFCDFVDMENDKFHNLRWTDPELKKENFPSLKPFIPPHALKYAISLFHAEFAGPRIEGIFNHKVTDAVKRALHKTESLAHMTQVSYYTGMRIDEVASLKINNVNFDGGIAICILESKTKNGERNIPFGRLASLEYIAQFKKYYERRKQQANGDALLFTQLSYKKGKDGQRRLVEKKWNTSYASREVARVFRKCTFEDFVFHNLRDSFASLLLFRWFFLFHGGKLPKRPKGLPCYEDDMFSEESLMRLRGLILGMGSDLKEGQELFTYALAVIARLMGHGGPMVTIKCYLHTTDWLFYFLSRHNNEQTVSLTSDQAVSFHQVTYSALPRILRKKGLKTIKVDEFLDGQRSLIKYSVPQRFKEATVF